jgi:hypothetical protein
LRLIDDLLSSLIDEICSISGPNTFLLGRKERVDRERELQMRYHNIEVINMMVGIGVIMRG